MAENKIVPFSDSAFVIDAEFRNLIPPLSNEERELLEKNIRLDGCREPLVIWNGILLDGHNRYEICQRLNIPFSTVQLDLQDRRWAINWIIENQLGRRNLHPDQASYLRGKRYNGEKKDHGFQDAGPGRGKTMDQNDPLFSTADRLATEYKVSAPTIKRDGQYAAAVDKLAEAGIEPQSVVSHVAKKAVIEMANAPGNLAEKVMLLQQIKESAKKTKKANRERRENDPYWISYDEWYPVLSPARTLAQGIEQLKQKPIQKPHDDHLREMRVHFKEIIAFYEDYLGENP